MNKNVIRKMVICAIAVTGNINAQGSAQQARFEAFVQTSIQRGELPISALTREQQADFGVTPLIVEQALATGVTSSQRNPVIERLFLDGLSGRLLIAQLQSLDLVFNSPRRSSAAFTSVRQLRRSGLIQTGGARLRRSEFRPSNGNERIFLNGNPSANLLNLGLATNNTESARVGRLIGRAAFRFINRGVVPSGVYPNRINQRSVNDIFVTLTGRTTRVAQQLASFNPNFNPIFGSGSGSDPASNPGFGPGATTPNPGSNPSANPGFGPGATTPNPGSNPSANPGFGPGATTPNPGSNPSSNPGFGPGLF